MSAGLTLLYFGGFGRSCRQKSAGDIDRRLHVLRGDVDRPVEHELQCDRRCSERTGGIHRGQSADLAELPFQRRRDRRNHHVRARAGIKCRDFNRRKIDRRQRGDRQEFVTEQRRAK